MNRFLIQLSFLERMIMKNLSTQIQHFINKTPFNDHIEGNNRRLQYRTNKWFKMLNNGIMSFDKLKINKITNCSNFITESNRIRICNTSIYFY